MASREDIASYPPLKRPALDIVDLTSDDEYPDETLQKLVTACVEQRDASPENTNISEEEAWESESLYEDALEAIGDEALIEGGRFNVAPSVTVYRFETKVA